MEKRCPNNCKGGRVQVAEAAGVPVFVDCAFCPDEPFTFTGKCGACGELIAGGGKVHRECEAEVRP